MQMLHVYNACHKYSSGLGAHVFFFTVTWTWKDTQWHVCGLKVPTLAVGYYIQNNICILLLN